MSTAPIPSAPVDPERDPLPGGASTNMWISFAAIVLFINGCFSAFYGLAALLNDDVVIVGGGEGAVWWDLTGWGWVMLLLGALMVLTAIGLFTGSGSARLVAIVFATLNALAQFAIVTAFPLWAILVITLDLVVIYQLVGRWNPDERR